MSRLPPAKNVDLAEVTMTPLSSAFSASSRSIVAPIAATYASFIVFADASGSLIVKVMTPASFFHSIMPQASR